MNDSGDSNGAAKGKSWERSWSTDEMRQNAHSWNLAGDAGLLKHLQEFSQEVLARTHTTEKSLDVLNEEINTLTSELNNTNNKFLCLANTQFVENRVYDDDDKETPQAESAPEKKSKEETEAKMLQKVREALSMSVAVLDTMFEPVEIQASDSDGESDCEKSGTKTLILEPHNPYMHRPLPHLIGSEQFMTDDQIGLGDTPSDDEDQSPKTGVDHDMETSSESDVDFTPLSNSKRDRDYYSSHSSMSDQPAHQERYDKHSKKMKPNTIKYSDEDHEEVPETTSSEQSAPTNSTFAAQLAAKLDKIASPLKNVDQSAPNISAPTKSTSDDLFGGVQTDDEDDDLFTSNSNLFSGRPKLFDDLKDTSDSLWGSEEPKSTKTVAPEIKKTEQHFPSHDQSRVTTDLFSSNVTDDEDDLFSIKPSKPLNSVSEDTKTNIKNPDTMSSTISKQHHLKVSEIPPGMATSTPERDHEVNPAKNTGLFGSVSQNLPQVVSSSIDPADKKSVGEDSHSRNDLAPLEKKPTGGVPMFGQANILAGLKAKLPRRQSSSSSESTNSDPSDSNSGSRQKSSATLPSVNQPTSDAVSADWSSAIGASQHSQSASLGFASPSLTSTRLSNDDGYHTRKVLDSVSSIPAANVPDNESDDDNIFRSNSSAIHSQNPPPLSGGLFAEVNDEDDDLFAVSPILKNVKKEKSQDGFERSDQRASKAEEKNAIPVTNEALKTRQPSSPKQSTNSSTKINAEKSIPQSSFYSSVPPPLKSESKIRKPVSLFDDSDSGEDEFLFSSASSAGSRRSQASADVLASAAVSSSEKKPLSKKGLFDDDDTLFGSARNDPDIDIFSEPSKPTEKSFPESKKPITNNNFDEENIPVSKDTSLHSTISTSDKSDSSESAKALRKGGSVQNDLFADSEDNDDLFSIKPNSAPKTRKLILDPPVIENNEDDLFQNISLLKPNYEEVLQSQSSLSDAKHDNFPAAPSKPSLLFENQTKTDMHASDVTVSDNTNKTGSFKERSSTEEPNVATQTSKKPEPPRTLNIRKETDPALGLLDDSEDDDDLFGASSSRTSVKTSSAPKPLQKPKIASKPEPISVSTSDAVKSSDNDNSSSVSIDKPPGLSEVDGATVSVSKLKDSLLAGSSGQPALKIDPRAFLPGQKPPPRRTPPKEDFQDSPVPSVKESVTNSVSENALGFEQPITNNATLPSANKDRAKLGVKRRPPSSKARREAARASMNLDLSDRESPLSPDASPIVTDSTSAVNNSYNSSNCVLSPSTDEDDLFGVPQDLPPEYGNQTLPSSDIFSGAPILSPLSSVKSAEQSLDTRNSIISREEKTPDLEDKVSLFSPPDLKDKSKTDDLFISQPISKQVSLPVTEKQSAGANSSQVHPIASNSLLPPGPVPDQVTQDSIKDISNAFSPSEALNKSCEDVQPKDIISSKPTLTTEIAAGASTTDPLNKVDQSLASNDDEPLQPENDIDDHSSLFPFVKKKPDNKPSNNQPLFSQTPALPSKGDLSVTKPGLGGLDDIDDDDLFSSSSKITIGKKTPDTSRKLKPKETKPWKFSDDDDDDDLFQSGSKSSSSKATNPMLQSSASPMDAKLSMNANTSSKPAASIKKSKQLQSASGNGLFSDENDEDDLFTKPSPFSKNKTKTAPEAKSATLFDDDDDDLFGSKSVSANKPIVKKNPKENTETHSQPRASSGLSNQDVFDDPLMSLGNKK
ncbi:WASH complex subunit 2 [Frankliniella fusca]|uniref:WASH complex subunit 2 n=1 Tax=Frankliniella fusca TaxID=407009 RepID=A0AAE1LQ33_9NEOP|nr:WASH complex subunit 2 [Frankliniella fusca]